MTASDFDPLASSRRFRYPLPKAGGTFAGYRIEREIARGGAGAVFVAQAPDGARYALKLFLGDMSQPVKRERFNREVTIGTSLRHAGIVRVLDHGEEAGRPYLVMELLDNARPIDRFVEEEGLTLMARAQLLMEAAQTVHTAHKAGIVHRDLKPDNVLVTAEGQVKVVDFGIARQLDLKRLTQSGAVMGTLHYMAPEQVAGQTKAISPRTDVYALGVIAYQLMSGELPIQGETGIEVMAAIAEGRFPALSEAVPNAPAGMSDVIQMAMATDHAQRYADAGAMAKDLLAVCTETETAASAHVPALKASPGRSLGLLLLAAAAVALALGASWWRAHQAPDLQTLRAEAKELRAEGRKLLANPTRFLSADADAVLALTARAEALQESAEPGPDAEALREALAPVLAVRGLLAIAQGQPDVAQRFVPREEGNDPELAALRAALANLNGEVAAARDLHRALRRGVQRPELHAWLIEALSRSGLESEREAELALASLERLESARGGELLDPERCIRAQAQHAMGDLAAATATLALLGDHAPPRLRWSVALDQTENLIANDGTEAAYELLQSLPRDLELPKRRPLNTRVQQLLKTGVEELKIGPSGDPAQARLAKEIRLATLLLPSEPLTTQLRERLTDAATSLDANAGLIHLAAALSDAYPDDRALQFRLASEAWRRQESMAEERLVLTALRRACAFAETSFDKSKFNTFLFKTLREANPARAFDGDEFEEAQRAAEVALAHTTARDIRLDLFRGLAGFYGDRGDHPRALEAAAQGLELTANDRECLFKRITSLRALKRLDELRDAIVLYSRLARGTTSADNALSLAWSLYDLGYPEEALETMTPHMPANAEWNHLWWLRLAIVRLRLGQRAEAAADLRVAESKLTTPKLGPAQRLVARVRAQVEDGSADTDALETLLGQLSR